MFLNQVLEQAGEFRGGNMTHGVGVGPIHLVEEQANAAAMEGGDEMRRGEVQKGQLAPKAV